MEIFETKSPIYKFKMNRFEELNSSILESIESMGQFSYRLKKHSDNITHTDWHLHPRFPRPYQEIIVPIVNKALEELKLHTTNVWFQQYCQDDEHGWHNHGGCNFSSVYYVELPKNIETTFKNHNGETFKIPVSEGDYIVFPSYLDHCSPKNETGERKTVIAMNLTYGEENEY